MAPGITAEKATRLGRACGISYAEAAADQETVRLGDVGAGG
jgi:hypothetical protein